METKPEIKKMEEVKDVNLFRCKTCTTEQEEKWLSWNKAKKLKIDDARFGLFCPDCECSLGVYSLEQDVDLSKVKKSAF